MLRAAHQRAAVVVAVFGISACQALGVGNSPAKPGVAPPPGAAHPRLEVREAERRPPIARVDRQGDPFPAVAVAIAHDGGSALSTGLAALLEKRLSAAGFPDVMARPHELGFQLSTLVDSPAAAGRFVQAAARALATPVSANEAGVAEAKKRLAALKARTWSSPAEAAVAHCTGELGVAPGAAVPEAAPTTLDGWRRQVDSHQSVAFAVLGPRAVLDAATDALAGTPEWPDQSPPNDPWPSADAAGATALDPSTQRLSLALRVADAPKALATARALGERSAVLSARLQTLDPSWHLERIVATTRPRGACLRLDARVDGKNADVRSADVAHVALLLRQEAERTLQHAKADWWAVEDGVLRAADPREATSVAAWRALSGRQSGAATRSALSYVGRMRGRDLPAALAAAQHESAQHFLEERTRVEPGQGEMWVLLASPCGTAGETNEDAGLAALMLHTLALRRPTVRDVVIEPWTSSDGVGLLAHAPRSSPNETSTELARRIADALGRTFAATRLATPQVAEARTELLERVGPGPRPGFWLTVDSVVPGHPGWLEPHGTFASLSAIQSHEVESARRTLLAGPLRMAVIANSDPNQVETARARLEEWLRPLRGQAMSCPKHAAVIAKRGELTLQTADESGEALGYVALALPAGRRVSREAEILTYLLNRPGGYLDQAIGSAGLGSARAELLGGRRAQGLIIEVHAFPDRGDDAVAQVRALLGRLARGAVSQKDLDLAERELSRARLGATLDPRQRVVDLWLGGEQSPATLATLRRYLATALRPEAQIVVRVTPRE
ncbi:MAG: hypothetical protein H6717_27160 [Polyangiaceae bacterium]|nr:hypothetical protein [Polyangiaceae bacterium]